MLVSRLFARRVVSTCSMLLVAACWAVPIAEAVSPSGDQWKAAGSQSAATASMSDVAASQQWAMPNRRPAAGTALKTTSTANPLRPNNQQPQVSAAMHEPRAFQAPASATPIATARPTANAIPASWSPQRGASAAVAPAAAMSPVAPQPRGAMHPAPAMRPAPNYRSPNQQSFQQSPRVAQQFNRRHASAPAQRRWAGVNVAFEGETVMEAPTEELPSPVSSSHMMQEPMMRSHYGVGRYDDPFNEGPSQPYGEACGCGPACGCGDQCNCGDGCMCGDSCSCGDACSCGDGVHEPGCGCGCGDACEPGCGCGTPGCDRCESDLCCIGPGDDESCHTVRVRVPKWQEVMVFGGVQGFKNPYDQNHDSGNFGFNEGFNIGAKLPYAEFGYQYGYRTTQNQLNGDEAQNINHEHFQQFATGGIFRRTRDGVQGGVVWDVLEDERFTSLGYHQLRSEISLISGNCHEFGFMAAISLNDRKLVHQNDDIFFEASDQFLLFYRFHGPKGGEGRFYGGTSEDAEAIIGSDMLLPVGNSFSVQGGFTYLIPDAPDGELGAGKEAWNVGLALVWHWHNQARKCHENRYRPLFNVADNGSLILTHRDND